jgi:hypothetical protein
MKSVISFVEIEEFELYSINGGGKSWFDNIITSIKSFFKDFSQGFNDAINQP